MVRPGNMQASSFSRQTFVPPRPELRSTLSAITPVDIPDKLHQLSASIGGPIVKYKKTVFFLASDYTRQNRTTFLSRALVQSRRGASFGESAPFDWVLFVLCSQRRSPDLRSGCRGSAELAGLELLLLDLLREFDAGDHYRRIRESLESQHRADPLFHSSMVLFNQIVQVLAGADLTRSGSSPSSFISAPLDARPHRRPT